MLDDNIGLVAAKTVSTPWVDSSSCNLVEVVDPSRWEQYSFTTITRTAIDTAAITPTATPTVTGSAEVVHEEQEPAVLPRVVLAVASCATGSWRIESLASVEFEPLSCAAASRKALNEDALLAIDDVVVAFTKIAVSKATVALFPVSSGEAQVETMIKATRADAGLSCRDRSPA